MFQLKYVLTSDRLPYLSSKASTAHAMAEAMTIMIASVVKMAQWVAPWGMKKSNSFWHSSEGFPLMN